MKRIVSLLMALALALACAPALAGGATSSDALTQDDKLEQMLPALDSIARAMGIDGTEGYAPRDAEFFWTVIYLMGQNWGYAHPLYETVEIDGQPTVSLPRRAVQEMATAAFFDYDDLPELVDTPAITYDELHDSYVFAPSDMGDTYTEIESSYEPGNGNVVLVLGFYAGEGTRLGGFDFTLAPNPYADGVEEPIYYYSVMAASAQPRDNG